MLSCDYCEYKTNQKSSLSRHLNAKHPELANSFRTCKTCNKEFMTSSSCRKHEIKCKPIDDVNKDLVLPEVYVRPYVSEIEPIDIEYIETGKEKEELLEDKHIDNSIKKHQNSWIKTSIKTFMSVAFMTLAVKFLFQMRQVRR